MDQEYQLKYELFLAENELFESFIGSGALLNNFDEANMQLITESLVSKVNSYISKVMTSTQNAWNNYKNKVANSKDKKYLNSIAPQIKSSNPNFTINNFPLYDLSAFNTIKIQQFSYEKMKSDMNSKEAFIKKYYARLVVDGKANVKDGLRNVVMKQPGAVKCDKKTLIASYNFCINGFYNQRSKIADDISVVNNSVTNITTAVKSVSLANEASNLYIDSKYSILNEAPSSSSMSFTDSDGEKTDMGDKKAQKSNESFLKAVNIYMDVSMDIITTKMKLLQEIYKANMNVLVYYIKWADKSKKQVNNATEKEKELKTKVNT